MGDFKELRVWNRAHALTLSLYRVTAGFPRDELFGLTQQIRRAAISVEANIAEGCGRRTDRELARFASIANGSANELQCEVRIARDLGYLDEVTNNELQKELGTVCSMLTGLIDRFRAEQRAATDARR